MSRLPPISEESLNESQKKALKAIQDGPRGEIPLTGPFAVWVKAGKLGDTIQKLGASLRYETEFDEIIKEMVICCVGYHYKAKFEFSYHSKLAINAGLSEKIIQNLREGAKPEFNDTKLDLAYRITNQLLQSHSVDDKAYTEGINEFGEQGMIELVSLVGYYCLVSLTLNIFEVPLDNGMEDPFPNKK